MDNSLECNRGFRLMIVTVVAIVDTVHPRTAVVVVDMVADGVVGVAEIPAVVVDMIADAVVGAAEIVAVEDVIAVVDMAGAGTGAGAVVVDVVLIAVAVGKLAVADRIEQDTEVLQVFQQ